MADEKVTGKQRRFDGLGRAMRKLAFPPVDRQVVFDAALCEIARDPDFTAAMDAQHVPRIGAGKRFPGVFGAVRARLTHKK